MSDTFIYSQVVQVITSYCVTDIIVLLVMVQPERLVINNNGELIVDLHLVKDDPADGGTEVALLRNGVQLYLFTSTGGTDIHRLYLSVKMMIVDGIRSNIGYLHQSLGHVGVQMMT